ncbi:Hemin transport protein hemS [Citrobacter freundii]|nr:Hemin transport protein hemS [Citrobacter freundii]
MTDVHQFFGLLKRHDLTRQQAFNLVGDDLACKVANSALAQLLDTARQDGNEIMVFVGNRGCVQIFTGVIEKLVPMKGWLNIFNPTFTLHLLEESVAETWVTRKPTADGHVTSLELFAADGTQIAQLYGQRTEGEPEQTQWRAQIDALDAERAGRMKKTAAPNCATADCSAGLRPENGLLLSVAMSPRLYTHWEHSLPLWRETAPASGLKQQTPYLMWVIYANSTPKGSLPPALRWPLPARRRSPLWR